jgi:TfoX/Sxy family transcriptional regulator of competence genes
MAYDEVLAQRIQQILIDQPALVSKKMFGGVGYILHGNMACGVHKESLIIRVGPDNNDQALSQPHTRPFDITGRPMTGWVMVAPEGCKSDEALEAWVRLGVDFALTLPGK